MPTIPTPHLRQVMLSKNSGHEKLLSQKINQLAHQVSKISRIINIAQYQAPSWNSKFQGQLDVRFLPNCETVFVYYLKN